MATPLTREEKHQYGMCGRGCPLCYEDRMAEDYRESQRPTVEEQCDPHPYFGDDGPSGRCWCGRMSYPLGGPVSDPENDAKEEFSE